MANAKIHSEIIRTYASVDSNSDDNSCIFLYYMREVLNVGYKEKRSLIMLISKGQNQD
ncbi:MAG: hypothetical protein O4749_05090 [Trichodesmium sp. St5_bin2_1]|nr:hypothetical protein [Trichodesmium sp. St5_bin2_1]